ncbi:MAG: hypothetical protein KF850_09270 [Labilithrix sp.]|nr:hypothetical protein [Labilithrix sp.]
MAEPDDMSLESELDQLERDVLASARDDVPPPEAREQLLAALNLPASTASAGRSSAWGGAGARVAQVVGLALAVGAASIAVVGLSGDDAETAAAPEAAAVAPPAPAATPEMVATIAAPASPQPPHAAAPGEPPPAEEATDVAAPNRPAPAPRGARPAQPAPDAPAELGARAPTTRSGAPARVESTLGRELARVTAARSALAGGHAARALGELDAYDAEFPAGAFSVEVAVLRIEALARSGRSDEARRLGDGFLAQHPRGLFARRVTTTLRGAGPAPEDPPTPAR